MAIEWGSIPVWISTVVGSTTATIAVINYRRAVLDKIRDQAARVASWISVEPTSWSPDPQNPHHWTATVRAELHVANRSDVSVYGLEASCEPPAEWMQSRKVEPQAAKKSTFDVQELPPGVVAVARPIVWHFEKDLSPDESPTDLVIEVSVPEPALTFTDALGRRWRRVGTRAVRRSRSRHIRPTAKIHVDRRPHYPDRLH